MSERLKCHIVLVHQLIQIIENMKTNNKTKLNVTNGLTTEVTVKLEINYGDI